MGDLFLLGSILKITKVTPIFVLFFPQKRLFITFDKNWFGLHFGRFFHTNSSGHPVWYSPRFELNTTSKTVIRGCEFNVEQVDQLNIPMENAPDVCTGPARGPML
jgi:hypothetical protein